MFRELMQSIKDFAFKEVEIEISQDRITNKWNGLKTYKVANSIRVQRKFTDFETSDGTLTFKCAPRQGTTIKMYYQEEMNGQ